MLRDDTNINDEGLVEEIFSTLDVDYTVEQCRRVGFPVSTVGRPIKVTLRSPDEVHNVLREAKRLKSVIAPGFSFKFNKLYLSAARNLSRR